MATANKSLQQPAYNSSTWDVPLNGNFGIIDSALGSTATISSSTSVTLTSDQYQCMRLFLNGTLGADINISIPSGVSGSWVITNYTTDSSAAVPCYVSIKTTAGGSNSFDAPRGSTVTIYSDGTTIYPVGNFVPAGQIISWGGVTAPSGYLACDGAAVARSTYSALFKAIGTRWGTGNGTTTFNTPNLANVFLRGSGASPVGTYEADTYLNHNHTASDSGHAHLIGINNSTGTGSGGGGRFVDSNGSGGFAPAITTGYANITVATSTTGGTETRPKNYRVLYCIKA